MVMRRILFVGILIIQASLLSGQIILTIEGQEFNDVITGASDGINITRSQPTTFTFRNNAVTSVNSFGYLLQAGDENPGVSNNNLDGEIISGNKFTWNGTDETSMTHAIFTGYNLDVLIKYNYLLNTPNGIQRKSNGMTEVNGLVAYNIIKNPKLGIAVKGINGIKIYNNTFYSEKRPDQTTRGLIDIHTNTDNELNAPSKGTKIHNNIFYTRNRVLNINIQDVACLEGFESDYNVFWCEAGSPVFQVDGMTKTFAMWQAMGYDLHSVVVNPAFVDFNDFVPSARLNLGKDLGSGLIAGLATDATWNRTAISTTDQNGTWQVGARILATASGVEEELLPRNMTLIYPNPTNGSFYLLLTDPARMYQTMKIFDSNGKIVLRRSVEAGKTEIPVSGKFAAGLYTVSLEAENLERYNCKLIILN